MKFQNTPTPQGPRWKLETDPWLDRALALVILSLLAPEATDRVLALLARLGL